MMSVFDRLSGLTRKKEQDGSAWRRLLLVFITLTAGIVTTGVYYYKVYEHDFRLRVDQQLSTIAEFKANDLANWRRERMGDAGVIFKNVPFSELVERFFSRPDDAGAREVLRAWIEKLHAQYQYDSVYLLDSQIGIRLTFPEQPMSVPSAGREAAAEVLRTGKVVLQDFYRDEFDHKIYLSVFIPIFDRQEAGRAIGVLVLKINPEKFLYPLIERWPSSSSTAETLLVRRDGDYALFLNELRFQKDAALNLRVSLKEKKLPAVMAILGKVGVVEGKDYRGVNVVADIRPIPGSPWFMVAKLDKQEAYAPLQEELWALFALVLAMILCSGAVVWHIWRRQSIRFYRDQAKASEALAESEERFRGFFERSSIGKAMTAPDGKLLKVNQAFADLLGYSIEELEKINLMQVTHPDDIDLSRKVIQSLLAGENPIHRFEKRFIRKDGNIVWADMNASRLHDVSGKLSCLIASIVDITARKQTEKVLHEKTDELDQFFNVALDLLCVANTDGYFKRLNPSWQTTLGYTLEELTNIRFLDLIHPDDLPATLEIMGELSLQNQVLNFVNRYRCKDGSYRWIEWRSFPKGAIIYAAARDITDRKRAEEALLDKTAYLENLLNYANAPIIVWDPQFRITRFNHAFELLTGRSEAEVIGQSLEILFPPALVEKSMGLIRETSIGERWETVEIEILHRDGSIRTVLWNSATLFESDGHTPIATIAQGQDITERKQVEKALQKTNAYLENLLNYANAPIIVWDPQFRITRFNHAFELLTGRSEAEVIGQSLEILFPPALVEESMGLIRETSIGERWETVEIEILHRQGAIRTVLWNSATLFESDGHTAIATIAQGQDITERKQAEKVLRKTLAELGRSNQELEQFAFVASHDLQEPLRTITGFVQLIAKRYADNTDENMAKYIGFIVDGASRMKRMINDLLKYSRVNTVTGPIVPVNANESLRDALESLAGLIHDTGAQVTSGELPQVLADDTQLKQLLQNLIENAIKFRGEKPAEVRIEAERKDNEWVFSIKDNGIGIAPEYFEKIFVIFQRLHGMGLYSGNGIGLAVCKKIVERHGGRIWVESTPGSGTTFFFTLPASEVIKHES